MEYRRLKNTTFFSKKQAQLFCDPENREKRVLISITTPAIPNSVSWKCSPAILHNDTWKDVLRLEFDDADPSHMNSRQSKLYRLFNEDDAIAVLKFLKIHQDDTVDAVVHCEAGISRSAAVSKFIAQIYSLQFPEKYQIYNKHVFSTLLRVHQRSLYGEGFLTIEDLPGVIK
jgi:predicted protein tyrosine phosphatase